MPEGCRGSAARAYDPATATLSNDGPATSMQLAEPPLEADGMGMEVADTLVGIGFAAAGYTPQVYLTGGSTVDVPAELSRVLLPTFTVPGVDGAVFLLRVAGAERWPNVGVYPAPNLSVTLNRLPAPDPWGR